LKKNNEGSPEYEEFLNLLGDKIELKGWQKHRGDLDVQRGNTGTHSIYTEWEGFHIMFHISTMLPFTEDDDQQLSRKRLIGNDVSVIIFQDGGMYVPPIVSKFLHVYAVVSPISINGKPHYRVAISSKKNVPKFGPPICSPGIFSTKSLKDWLLAKAINGHLSTIRADDLSEKMFWRPKAQMLSDIVKCYEARKAQQKQ